MSDRRSHESFSPCAAVLLAALLSSSVATAATTHQPNYTPRVIAKSAANTSFNGTPNTMMYTVTATVDDTFDDLSHQGVVGFTTETGCGGTVHYTWSPDTQIFNRKPTRTWTLYNFQPGVAYYYAVRTGVAGSYQYSCGTLGTPTLPTALEDLGLVVDNSSGAYATKYVMFDTDDCAGRNYVLAVDADTGNIVWYLDTEAITGVFGAEINGWRFQPRGTRFVSSDRMLLTIDVDAEHRRELLYEVELDGTVVNAKDFNQPDAGTTHACDGSDGSAGPCPHHDAFKSDRTGKTWVIVSEASGTGIKGNPFWTSDVCTAPPYEFLTDGFQMLERDYTESFTQFLAPDLGYDPSVDGGPAAPSRCAATGDWSATLDPDVSWLDWFHVNTIAPSPDGRFVDLSIRNWSQIIRVRADGSSTAPEWRLSGDRAYSDFGRIQIDPGVEGAATFEGQHDVHFVDDDTMVLFDNKGIHGSAADTYESRVLSIDFTFVPARLRSATIEKSWALVSNDGSDPLSCPTRGSGELVPGDPSGESVLALCHAQFVIEELNDSTGNLTAPALYIGLSTPTEDACISSGSEVDGFYRAYPLERLGDF
jgi:hypothetical protein